MGRLVLAGLFIRENRHLLCSEKLITVLILLVCEFSECIDDLVLS